MTPKDQYVMGRAEFLNETEGISLTEACKIAEQEWEWRTTSKKKIDHFVRLPGSVCQNCRFRKEYYKNVPKECKECGHFNQRNASYYAVLPVFKEDEN